MRDKDDFQKYLKMVAPGTLLNEGLENILRARTGALIVVGDSDEVMELVDGGFRIDSDFNPAALYELAKMDGAIILSSDAKRILFANTQLNPDPMIPFGNWHQAQNCREGSETNWAACDQHFPAAEYYHHVPEQYQIRAP